MAAGRFDFPGFAIQRTQDTSTHQVEVGTITDGGKTFVLTMLRNAQFLNLDFLIANVALGGKEIWNFKNESFAGAGVLAKAGDETIIALVGRGKDGKVERVIPLSYLVDHQQRDLSKGIALKRAAAEYLGREYVLSESEQALVRLVTKRQREQERQSAALAAEAREAARLERIRQMLIRPKVSYYTPDGKHRSAIPVLETEWRSVTPGTWVVVVDSLDPATGKAGKPVAAFQVVKEGRGQEPQKKFASSVTADPPARRVESAAAVKINPIKKGVVFKDDAPFEVGLYGSMDQIRSARAQGLNSGTWAAVFGTQRDGKIQVYAVHSDRIDTVGLLEFVEA